MGLLSMEEVGPAIFVDENAPKCVQSVKGRVVAKCDRCDVELELWLPPMVICRKCGDLYPWTTQPMCVTPGSYRQLFVELHDG